MSGRRARGWVLGAAGVAALVTAGVLVVGGDESEPPAAPSGPRAVTAAEADRLAVMRFRLYRANGVHFRTEVSSAGSPLSLVGDVDYRGRTGRAQVTGAGSSFVLQWATTTLLAWPTGAETSSPSRKPLSPTQSAVDAVLALLLELGQDRPDNAQLIRENGARWLRADTVGSTAVDVMQGPAAPGSAPGAGGPVTYWVDRDGDLLRLDVFIGGGSTPTVVDIDPVQFTPFARSHDLPG